MSTRGHPGQDPATVAEHRRRWMGRRFFVLLLVVGIAAAVALWPGKHVSGRPSTVGPADLAPARAKAALRLCPTPAAAGGGPVALRVVRAPCLSDGTEVDMGAGLAGRSTLINLWASWCEVCREELRVLDAYATTPDAVPVLGVQILSAPEDGLALLASLGVRLPSVLDTDGTVSRALRAPAYVPVSYLVTGDGTVRQVLPPTPFTSAEQVARTVRNMTVRP